VKRILVVVAALAAFAACGSAAPATGAAAVVNGDKISNQAIVDELQAIAGNADYLKLVEGQVLVTGQTAGSFDAAFAAQILTVQIQYLLVDQEVRHRKLKVGAECTSASRTDEYRRLDSDPKAGQAIFEKFPKPYQNYLIQREANRLALQGDLIGEGCVASDDAAKKYFDTHKDEFQQTCASHILLDTEDEANAVEAQLQAGADFATLATTLSKDTGSAANGGDLGCYSPGDLVPEFEAAADKLAIGEISPPVQSQFGWHVIKVTDRKTPAYDDVKDKAASKLAQVIAASFQNWFDNALATAKITVDGRYGTWDDTTGQVTSPDASAASSTTLDTAPGS
jgi:foldase protein PrsA